MTDKALAEALTKAREKRRGPMAWANLGDALAQKLRDSANLKYYDYAEMAYLMIPRPFMVERGHHDRVARDQWVAHEYAKVRWLYTQFGLGDKTAIEYFNGGHTINAEGTFEFLDTQLNWRKP